MGNLISSKDLTLDDIEKIMERAYYFQQNNGIDSMLQGRFAVNLFMEPSTRTRFSFEVAEKKLGLHVLNFQSDHSSLQKGESFYDTLKTLESMGVELAVVRLKEEEILREVTNRLAINIMNAGEGTKEHPTQALLDLYTIKKYFHEIKNLRVAIIGDINHSRVARSNADILSRLGARLIFSGPEHLMAKDLEGVYLPIDEAIAKADVVIMLRIQFERQVKGLISSKEQYNREFGFTKGRLGLLKEHAIILHPAPVNRGIEMDDEVVEHPKTKIFQQIHHGVWVRMAAIEWALGGK